MKSRSISTCKISEDSRALNTVFLPALLTIVLFSLFLFPPGAWGRIYIDINAPSLRKFKIAIPEFKALDKCEKGPNLGKKFSRVISNDLELCGFFAPIERQAFLTSEIPLTLEEVIFKDWTAIGAELLLTGGYTCIGSRVEVEARLFDLFWGRQIMGKRFLGDIRHYREIMHRLAEAIIMKLTGEGGIFLTKLAFVSNRTGHKEIYVSDFDGQNAVQITQDKSIAMMPRWSPDGNKLLYISYKGGSGPMLYMIDLDLGRSKLISGRKGLNIGASWTPDGKKIALTLSTNGNPDIYLIDLSGKILKRLTDHWAIDVSPTFSPDGKKMAFVSNRSGSPQIYVMELESGKVKRLTFEGKYNTSPSWSKQNRIAYASMNHGSFDICTIDAEGGEPRYLTQDQGQNEDPSWSPNGRYIVFSSNRTGRYHLYIMTARGQNQRRITFVGGDHTAPSWSGSYFRLSPRR